MKNKEQPAFSCITAENVGGKEYSGLTKREYFAVTILSGLSVMAIAGGHNSTKNQKEELVPKAIELADELLKQLEQ